MKVLAINTYGGSLLLGARMAGAEIVATMEDTGFGSDLQAWNFPEVANYPDRGDWPESHSVPWDEITVIAHPPCASFSQQNNKKARRGLQTDGFRCHESVIRYSLGHGCKALTLESVIPAYEAACDRYEELALEFGYGVTYIMLNSVSFGVPQWRPRLWVIFHKNPDNLFHVHLDPVYRTVRDVLDPAGTTWWESNGHVKKAWDELVRPLIQPGDHGKILPLLQRMQKMESQKNFGNVRQKFNLTGFSTALPVILDPWWFAPTVVSDSLFMDHTRPLTIEEYCEIAGFPRHYLWGRRWKQFRMYLSKEVAPPVAEWVLRQIDCQTPNPTHSADEFGEVIDLRPKKSEVQPIINERRQLWLDL